MATYKLDFCTSASIADVMRGALEASMRYPSMEYSVYLDAEGGYAYIWEDVDGGNTVPKDAWEGKDRFITSFRGHNQGPEEIDPCSFRAGLVCFLSDEQKETLRQVEEEDGELANWEIGQMFPEEFSDCCEDAIREELSGFDPDREAPEWVLDEFDIRSAPVRRMDGKN